MGRAGWRSGAALSSFLCRGEQGLPGDSIFAYRACPLTSGRYATMPESHTWNFRLQCPGPDVTEPTTPTLHTRPRQKWPQETVPLHIVPMVPVNGPQLPKCLSCVHCHDQGTDVLDPSKEVQPSLCKWRSPEWEVPGACPWPVRSEAEMAEVAWLALDRPH